MHIIVSLFMRLVASYIFKLLQKNNTYFSTEEPKLPSDAMKELKRQMDENSGSREYEETGVMIEDISSGRGESLFLSITTKPISCPYEMIITSRMLSYVQSSLEQIHTALAKTAGDRECRSNTQFEEGVYITSLEIVAFRLSF